jgi:cystinosin
VTGFKPGHFEVIGNSTPPDTINDDGLFIRVIVAKSRPLILISSIVGWIYFVSWSVSFYPQVFLLYQRKSAVGYSFDYAALNMMGNSWYCLYNVIDMYFENLLIISVF